MVAVGFSAACHLIVTLKNQEEKMKLRIIFLFMLIIVFLVTTSSAEVPKMINYQGKLTTPQGALIDTTINMTFAIYTDSIGTDSLWSETQSSVVVEKGIFSVLLGNMNPIPDSVFTGAVRYLGLKTGDDPEMTPRKAMVSVAYAYRAGTVPSGGFDCSDCDDRFVNVQGPDSVVTGSGTAFSGKVMASTELPVYGIKGYAYNNDTATGDAYGGYFSTSPFGLGTHIGVYGGGKASSNTDPGIGCYGYGENLSSSSGHAFGGIFQAAASGAGEHYGVRGSSINSSAYVSVGVEGSAINTSTGSATGGIFNSSSMGTGEHYGVQAYAWSSSAASAYGNYSTVYNDASGTTYGGYFYVGSEGSGTRYGVYAEAPPDRGWAGYFDGDVRINDSLVVLGGKSVAVKVGSGEYRLLYCQESTENWFEDFGGGKLQNGATTIQIDPLYAQTVNTQIEYRIYLTPEGDCKGLYVTNKTPNSFEVRELQGGNSNITFSYRIVAKRKGFENIRLAKMGGPTPEDVAVVEAAHQAQLEHERQKMEEGRAKIEQERTLR
jgi:hypothetical protein